MAGTLQVIAPRRTGLQEFSEGMSPYLQLAFKQMLERKYQDQQRQRNIELVQQAQPQAFTPDYQAASLASSVFSQILTTVHFSPLNTTSEPGYS